MFEKWRTWTNKEGTHRIEFWRLIPGWKIDNPSELPAPVVDAVVTPIIEIIKGVTVSRSNGVDPNEGYPYLWGCLLGTGAFLCIVLLLILVLTQSGG